ncbi:hypothetical protein HK405_004234 [Cladochytrium tenue]|nr:hypothetical protein HK405_004234 [Cladochytrium tenue]
MASTSMAQSVEALARRAREAALRMQAASGAAKSAALRAIHASLVRSADSIIAANKVDLEHAAAEVAAGRMSQSLLKRLDLGAATGDKYASLLQGVLDVDKLPDPTDQITLATRLDDGLDLYRVTAPIGVLLVIFEARPEVVVQISSLSLKSSNAVILKGGKEASRTNAALFAAIREALAGGGVGVPEDAVQLVETRADVDELLAQDRFVDLVIPRGSAALVRHVQSHTRIPVLGHADGLCSTYVDASADADTAERVLLDAKMSYPAACNATETLLLDAQLLASGAPLPARLLRALLERGVAVDVPDSRVWDALPAALLAEFAEAGGDRPLLARADASAFNEEYLGLRLAVGAVDGVEGAIAHVNSHGSRHTDAIVTEDAGVAERFMRGVDAAGVYWNASTRFADGFRYGFGAEIGVSTSKTHARGPVGLEGLVTYKYRLYGRGHVTSAYGEGAGKRRFLHEPIPVDEDLKKKFRQ